MFHLFVSFPNLTTMKLRKSGYKHLLSARKNADKHQSCEIRDNTNRIIFLKWKGQIRYDSTCQKACCK